MRNMAKKAAKIYLLGGGPGDPELLTLKAVKVLQKADCVLYDNLINKEILDFCPQAEKVFVGKSQGNHLVEQEQINLLLQEKGQQFSIVVRLKGGDPFLFARGGEELKFLLEQGFEVEVLSGISAFAGASASLAIPLTHRDYSSQLIVLTGHKRQDNNYQEFNIDLTGKTLVVYMTVTALSQISQTLLQLPQNKNSKAMLIENATLPNEKIVWGKLADIALLAQKNNIKPPALLLVGEVISFWQHLPRST